MLKVCCRDVEERVLDTKGAAAHARANPAAFDIAAVRPADQG
jgi:hypothetical protein